MMAVVIEHRVPQTEAVRLVQAQLERERHRYVAVYGSSDVDLAIGSVENVDVGWLVFYRSAEAAVRAGAATLVGHGPYLVDGEDGALFVVPARAYAAGEWIEDFRARFKGQVPDPLVEAAREVREAFAAKGRAAAVRRLRVLAPGLGMAAAVSAVEGMKHDGALPGEVLEHLADRPVRKAAAPVHPVAAGRPVERGRQVDGVAAGGPRVVGDFHELGHGNPEGPSIRWAVRPQAAPYGPELVRYLRSGTVLAAAPALVFDVLGAQDSAIGGLSVCTDGVWLWYSDLAHYVEHHHVELDPQFIAHARARRWEPPRSTASDLLGIERELFGSDSA